MVVGNCGGIEPLDPRQPVRRIGCRAGQTATRTFKRPAVLRVGDREISARISRGRAAVGLVRPGREIGSRPPPSCRAPQSRHSRRNRRLPVPGTCRGPFCWSKRLTSRSAPKDHETPSRVLRARRANTQTLGCRCYCRRSRTNTASAPSSSRRCTDLTSYPTHTRVDRLGPALSMLSTLASSAEANSTIPEGGCRRRSRRNRGFLLPSPDLQSQHQSDDKINAAVGRAR